MSIVGGLLLRNTKGNKVSGAARHEHPLRDDEYSKRAGYTRPTIAAVPRDPG